MGEVYKVFAKENSMRTYSFILAVALALGIMASQSVAAAAEGAGITSHVPLSIAQVGDETLRMALGMYSPNYDSLSHQGKVNAYTNIYKAMYNTLPPLTADDSALRAAGSAPTIVYETYYPSAPVHRYGTTSTNRYEPWWDPMWNPRAESAGVMHDFYNSGLPHTGWHWTLP